METLQDFIPQGRRNRPGYKLLGPRYITIHDTANTNRGADALAHARYLKGDTATKLPVSWHFTVDDRRVIQHLPLDEVGWHAGDGPDGPGNRSSLGIEICENQDGNRKQAEQNAAQLVAGLLRQFALPVQAVVEHHRWNGKDCPHILRHRAGGWEGFLAVAQQQPDPAGPRPSDPAEEVRHLNEALSQERSLGAKMRSTLQEILRLVRDYGG